MPIIVWMTPDLRRPLQHAEKVQLVNGMSTYMYTALTLLTVEGRSAREMWESKVACRTRVFLAELSVVIVATAVSIICATCGVLLSIYTRCSVDDETSMWSVLVGSCVFCR